RRFQQQAPGRRGAVRHPGVPGGHREGGATRGRADGVDHRGGEAREGGQERGQGRTHVNSGQGPGQGCAGQAAGQAGGRRAGDRGGRRDAELTASADSVRAYLKQIGKVPLLNAEQEVELAKRIEAGLYAAERLRAAEEGDEQLTTQLRRDFEWISRDGERAKNHLLEAN